MRYAAFAAAGWILLCIGEAGACELCTPGATPLSVEIAKAKCVVVGTVTSAHLSANGLGGTCDLHIDAVIKPDDAFKASGTLKLSRYFPANSKIKLLVFLDYARGRWDDYRHIDFPSDRIVKYLRESPGYNERAAPEERAERLRYFFKFLNDPEPAIAMDAYREWAVAGNREVGLVAGKLPAAELRAWFLDRKTPPERLSLYGFLLGACGESQDADMLRNFLKNPDERTSRAMVGLLAGFIHLRSDEGWQMAKDLINDSKKPFPQRHAVLRTLRFYYGYQPNETRSRVLECLALMLRQEDLLDLAVQQLGAWNLWDHTDAVIAIYSRANLPPITKRAIIRYALCCPLPKAGKFIQDVRKTDPDLVDEVQQNLQASAAPLESATRRKPQTGIWLLLAITLFALSMSRVGRFARQSGCTHEFRLPK
jgi:hypothetical protein